MQLLSGLIHVIGEPDTGKSTFALECGANPKKILYIDDDVKGRATVEDLRQNGVEFGKYVDLVPLLKGKTELDVHEAGMKLIREIKSGEYDAIIWDTWTQFASSCHAFVLANPSKFLKIWAPNGRIKSGQEWGQARRLEKEIASYLTSLATTVILVTHLKNAYVSGIAVPEKYEPACSPMLEKAARLRIWLRHNPDSSVPIGLVLKRLDKKHIQDGRLRTVSVLPRKITPIEGEQSLWDSIARYWDNPIGDRKPLPEETPNEFELSILDSTLTREQRLIFTQLVENGIQEKEELEAVAASSTDGIAEQVRELADKGKALPVIASKLKLTLSEVKSILDQESAEKEIGFMR